MPKLSLPRKWVKRRRRHQRVYARLRRVMTCDVVRCNPGSNVPLALLWVPALRSSAKGAAPRPGHEWNLLSLPCGDLPVGWLVDRCVQPCLQKYFASPVGQIISTNSRHPVPHRGAYRDRHERGMGCGGRGSVLRATGLQGRSMRPVSDYQASGREMLQRTAKSCGPDAPTLASSFAGWQVGPTGCGQASYPRMTVAREPGHRGEHDIC